MKDADASAGAEIYGDVLHGDVQVPENLAQLQKIRAYVIRRMDGAPCLGDRSICLRSPLQV